MRMQELCCRTCRRAIAGSFDARGRAARGLAPRRVCERHVSEGRRRAHARCMCLCDTPCTGAAATSHLVIGVVEHLVAVDMFWDPVGPGPPKVAVHEVLCHLQRALCKALEHTPRLVGNKDARRRRNGLHGVYGDVVDGHALGRARGHGVGGGQGARFVAARLEAVHALIPDAQYSSVGSELGDALDRCGTLSLQERAVQRHKAVVHHVEERCVVGARPVELRHRVAVLGHAPLGIEVERLHRRRVVGLQEAAARCVRGPIAPHIAVMVGALQGRRVLTRAEAGVLARHFGRVRVPSLGVVEGPRLEPEHVAPPRVLVMDVELHQGKC
mmetsp:Transcript_18783/g.50475  ORF Transcript_18783/g.50475 Transcript_18783/m.50475 type:complete len:328 (+) Transcript_18783:522-1505(+)